jgi:hypothetical protein
MEMNKTMGQILVFGILILPVGLVTGYRSSANTPAAPPAEHGEIWGFGLRIENTTGGDWLITVASGSAPLKSVWMQITNSSTGGKTVDKLISAIVPAKNDPDAVFIDNNANNRIDAGDIFILKGSSVNVLPGYKVQFLKGMDIIGTISEIPPA